MPKSVEEKERYIIGIGASAGGLDAINELFNSMPDNTGFSFIVVQHLSPDHKSLMAELLSKHTPMQVYEAEDGAVPAPDRVYLTPAGKIITLKQGKLRLKKKERDHYPNNAIDVFLESLADDKGDKAVGIILSGTGTDGTKGIKAIKKAGGTIIVQDPITAQFDGMPVSAISSGFADLILPPEMIAEELIEYLKETPFIKSFNTLNNQEEAVLLDILELIFKTNGIDFSNYKRPTIGRRLAKRMAGKRIKSIEEYYRHLMENPDEIEKLSRDFLLSVTCFFRDEEAFEKIRTSVIPQIVDSKHDDEPVKVWALGCSTGEEAYSIAMLFNEYLAEQQRRNVEVKIFASDIVQDAIETASKGFYTAEQVKNIPERRLKKYFSKEGGGYRIITAIRKMIVFARHDVVKDPPFGKIDLITCRNMLIYMNASLQKSILQKLHFAINEDGYMFLGPSENPGILKDALKEIDKKWKIYKCTSKTRIAEQDTFSGPAARPGRFPVISKSKNALSNLPEIFKETLLEEYEFAGVLIDPDYEVKQAVGNFKKFLQFPDNTFNFNLLKLVPPDLSIALSTGIRTAIKENERVVQKNINVHSGSGSQLITVIIKPYLLQKAYMQPFIFIILKEEEPIKRLPKPPTLSKKEFVEGRIEELESELKITRENLQALLEEVESSNEELQTSNEEIISSNEELQSTNEELQSLNEELHTVNAEHQLKIKELQELNEDLNNYFINTDVGQIFLDRGMNIRKFTPAATKQVNLIYSDIGRSIADLSTNLKGLDFLNDIKKVMTSGKVIEKEVSLKEHKIYLMRIAPYLRQDKSNDGIVISFFDISEIKKMNRLLEAVFNSTTSGILALKAIREDKMKIVDFEIIAANDTAQVWMGAEDQLSGKSYHQMNGRGNKDLLKKFISVVNTGATESFEFYDSHIKRWMEVNIVKMMDGVVSTFNDITDKKEASETIKKNFEALKEASQKLELSNYKLEQSNLDLMQFASVASHDLQEPLRKVQAFGGMLKKRAVEKLDSTEIGYLEKVVNSTNRMQALIEDMLTLSRLSKNNTPRKKINLNEVIANIIDDLEISIKDKNAVINVEALPEIKGNSGQMHQLFQNLISNALKFNSGRPEIHIGIEKLAGALEKQLNIKASDFTAVFVQDNGIGFDNKFHEKIFGIFQRLEGSNYQGTGIGLAIVKKIVENHKGYIMAKGEKGKGSRFTIIFPSVKA